MINVAKCPLDHVHERLAGDVERPWRCVDCGSEVVHAQAASDGPDEAYDYAVWCTSADCAHHVCTQVGDMDCPEWAHGSRERKARE